MTLIVLTVKGFKFGRFLKNLIFLLFEDFYIFLFFKGLGLDNIPNFVLEDDEEDEEDDQVINLITQLQSRKGYRKVGDRGNICLF